MDATFAAAVLQLQLVFRDLEQTIALVRRAALRDSVFASVLQRLASDLERTCQDAAAQADPLILEAREARRRRDLLNAEREAPVVMCSCEHWLTCTHPWPMIYHYHA